MSNTFKSDALGVGHKGIAVIKAAHAYLARRSRQFLRDIAVAVIANLAAGMATGSIRLGAIATIAFYVALGVSGHLIGRAWSRRFSRGSKAR